ncbi:MAG: hypothetical protein HY023_18280 [Chloroflexi bacterium]|nr:hypothetical protein [Chloroflexota bacterium]
MSGLFVCLECGTALIVGAFTGIAAFFGGFMNWNFRMAGSASANPMLFAIAVVLILAGKVSGYIGADFVLLRWLGTPWGGAPAEKVEEPARVKQVITVQSAARPLPRRHKDTKDTKKAS